MDQFTCTWGNLAFQMKGEGQENYPLVHNAGGNHQLMRETFAHFSSKGKTLCLDLRGHGQSHSPKMEYTVESYAQDLFALCQYCGMDNITFIGLNFGGNVGISLHQLYPQIVSRLVLIEPPVLMDPWIIEFVKEHIRDLHNEKSVTYADHLVESTIVHAATLDREIAKKAFETTPRHVQISTYENLLLWDRSFKNGTSKCNIPTLCIQTSRPFGSEEKLLLHFSKLHVCRVFGSGPGATLEAPLQTNAMIERFLTINDLSVVS